MRFIAAISGLVILALTACSSQKPIYDQNYLSNVLQPKPGMAKLVLYYPYSSYWENRKTNITAGGLQGCRLMSGNSLALDIIPGKNQISTSLCNGNAVTRISFTAIAGNKYYAQITPKDDSLAGRIAAKSIQRSSKNMHAEGAAFIIDILDEQTAMPQLISLKMAAQ